MPTLLGLLADARLPAPVQAGGGPVEVTTVTQDSRRAAPGTLFVAVPGYHVDGHAFAARAVAAGAVAVVAEHVPDPPLPAGTALVLVDDARAALSPLAAVLAGRPSERLHVAGVTGTDGKTTTTTMLHAAWTGGGLRAASLTTVDFRVGTRIEPNGMRQTTLEAPEVQASMAQMLGEGCTHLAMETSSHSLAMHRVDDVAYRTAVYTRITSEHLDFHGTREEYRAAKARLLQITARRRDGLAVLDRDDAFGYPHLVAIPVARRVTYSASGDPGADLRALDITVDAGGVRFTAETPWGTRPLALQLAGRFNAANALAALAAACAGGVTLEAAASGLEALPGVSGRMERVVLGQPYALVVDYAHTAESLERVLTELRAATAGRLWVVFGSAGERDRSKRPEMGRIAAELADIVVVTDEDPRDEDPARILEEIAAGARSAGARDGDTLQLVQDRAQAVRLAVDGAAPGDTVLLAGKGHESNILGAGGHSDPWDERGVAEAAVRARLAREGV